jgi:hypothetical protein
MSDTVAELLMFEGTAEEAMAFSISLLPNSKVLRIERYGPGEPGKDRCGTRCSCWAGASSWPSTKNSRQLGGSACQGCRENVQRRLRVPMRPAMPSSARAPGAGTRAILSKRLLPLVPLAPLTVM